MLRSHDQVNDFEALSDWLMKEHPEVTAKGLILKKNEWQSCGGTLVIKFQWIINNCIHNGNLDFITMGRDILTNPFVPIDIKKHGETMYYLAGVVVKIINNLSLRSKDMHRILPWMISKKMHLH